MKFMADNTYGQLFRDLQEGTKVLVRTRNNDVNINSTHFSEGRIIKIYPCPHQKDGDACNAKTGCTGFMDIEINGKIIEEKCIVYSTHDNKSCIYAWEDENQFIEEGEMEL